MRCLLTVSAALLLTIAAWAQPQDDKNRPRFNPEEFKQRMEQALTKEACLTPEEAKAFFPIYYEMKEKQRACIKQIRDLKQKPYTTQDAYAEAIAKIKNLQLDMAKVEQEYYKKLVKAVPAEKVFKAMTAEDKFHRQMVQGPRKPHEGGKR